MKRRQEKIEPRKTETLILILFRIKINEIMI